MTKELLFIVLLYIYSLNVNIYAQETKIEYYDIDVSIIDSMRAVKVLTVLSISNLNSLKTDTLTIDLCKGFKGVFCDSIRVYADNRKIDFIVNDENEINVFFSDSFKSNRSLKLNVDYILSKAPEYGKIPYSDFAFQVNKDLIHINSAITRTDNWIPKLSNAHIDRLPSFKLNVEIPAGYEVMASGELTEIVEKNGNKKYCYKNYEGITDRGLYFFINRNKKIEQSYPGGFKIFMYIPSDTLQGSVRYLSDVVYESYKHYESVFGETNLNEYKISAFVNSSMGYSGLYNSCNIPEILFTDSIINNELYAPIRNVIHEVSHTWWGNIIAANANKDYWLFEGFAKFSEPIFLRSIVGPDIELLYQKRLKLVLFPVIDNVPPLRFNSLDVSGSMRNSGAYYQGALFLLNLKHLMGEENFWKGMKMYVSANRGKLVDSDDFYQAMQGATDIDIKEYYYDYLNKPGFAEYSINFLSSKETSSGYTQSFEILNTGQKELFTSISLHSDLQDDTMFIYIPKGESKTIEVNTTTPDTADLVKIDPDGIFLVRERGMCSPGTKLYTGKDGRLRLTGVVAGSPFAKAGLKSRMIVVSIDGQDLADYDIYEKHSFLQRKRGSKIKGVFVADDNLEKEYIIDYL